MFVSDRLLLLEHPSGYQSVLVPFCLCTSQLCSLHLGAIVDTIIVAVVWVLSLANRWLSDAILGLRVVNLAIAVLASVVWLLVAKGVVFILVVGVVVVREVVDSSAIGSMALTVCVELVRVSMLG